MNVASLQFPQVAAAEMRLTWAALTIEARLLIAIALVTVFVAFRSNRRRAQLRRQKELDPLKRAIYNPKQFRRPR
ncbi:hypothetical protein LRP76_05855 [Burkholderia pseudomallei]|uniref:hypothetical protein n=1 Tax=Burkholderia pseudomallei TaxID=28450 RepID=UPI000A7B2C37|nr:hypothetical protein [Burkholderia pseudomallei]MCD4518114.1 hypothetical protein [Burkholderia pseudomallei]MCW0130107.1 hypothetical protein [Burkholderia pseudomallei]MDA5593147.1 hypothetical protein [Burkholderia pseudomallei]WCE19770.1 hypothetical protein PL318_00855 [Burkholderia pseudomallei]WCK62137.1 hypothetical protein AQ936_028795 [Burkholderia pseudomallei]